jgi:hypothetical protein
MVADLKTALRDLDYQGGGDGKSRFKLLRLTQVSPTLNGRYLIKGLLQSSALHLVWGPPKCGKSFLVMDMAGHVACGKPYRGLRVRQGPVVYIAAEGVEGFKARALAWRRHHLDDGEDPPLFILGKRVDLVAEHKSLVADIRDQVGSDIPTLVVIDTLNRTFAGSESSDEDMTAYIAAADMIKETFGCAVVIVHHCGHEATRPRGHTALMGAVDVQIAVTSQNKVITAAVDFAKDMPDDFTTSSKLRVVEIGTDEDGDEITTCIIEPTDAAPAQTGTRSRLPASQQIALNALMQAVGEHGTTPPASNHIPTTVKTVSVELWRKVAYARNISDATQHAKNAAFNRAAKDLQRKGLVGAWNDQVWPIGTAA